jgi:hypothetical protein
MSIVFSRENFVIDTAENGNNALHKVIDFINFHNKIRETL